MIDCLRNRIYFNTDPAKRAHLGGTATGMGWTAVPLTFTNHHYYAPATLHGRHYSLVVDTGSFATLLRAGFVRTEGGPELTTHRTRVLSLYGQLPIYTFPARELTVGTFELTRPEFIGATDFRAPFPTDGPHGPWLGLLGTDSLTFNAALIDCAENKLYLRHVAARGH